MDKEKLKAALKARLYYAETTGGDYKAVEKASTGALGKYQFVPSVHWEAIEKLARDKNYNKGEKIDHGYFLNSEALQEEYFDQHFDYVYGRVQSAMKVNKRNLSPDAIAQLVHMNPDSVNTYVKGGEWKIPNAKNNSSVTEFLRRGEQGLKEFGLGLLKDSDVMPPEEIDSTIKEFFTKREELVKKLDSGELSKGSMSEQLKALEQDIKNKGLIGQVNTEANRRFQEKETEFRTERSTVSQLYSILSNPEREDHFRREYDSKGKLTLKAEDKVGADRLAEIIKSSNGNLKYDKDSNGKSNSYSLSFDLTGRLSNGKYLKEGIKKYAGIDLPEITPGVGIDKGLGQKSRGMLSSITGKGYDTFLKQKGSFDKNLDRGIVNKRIEASELGPLPEPKETGTINSDGVITNKGKTGSVEVGEGSFGEPIVEEEDTKKSSEFYGLSEMEQPDFVEYDKDAYKKEIPFEAAAQGLLGAMGMAAADNKIPERDEKIAAGMQDYIDKIAELTRIGLPPELEAQAKNDLATAYQLGLSNIVRASGGNRNAVLGNQGQLDASKMMGETQIAIADFQAKVDAGNKYGEAMKYVNEFKARKDIANKEMEQTLAMQEREAGGMLAASGFTNMIKSIQDAKERAPGSAYHMMKTKYAMDTFGYDPEMKDDGTGKAGTKSAFLKMRDNINNTNSMKQNILGKYEAMDTQGKLSFEKEYNQNLGKWDYLSQKANELSGMGNNSLNLNSTDPQTKPLQNDTTMTENDFKAVDTTSDLSTMMAFQSNRYSV